jgi:predicted acetyltransferase
MTLDYRAPTADELEAVVRAVTSAFGEELRDEELERERKLMSIDRVLAAWDGDTPVGAAASWPFELTIPGGTARAAGVTWVGVLPSHRRRGVLTELMRRQLADVRERGEPLAILWASEAPIYGRYGYGVAVPELVIDAERSAFALRDDPGPKGRVRLVSFDEALELFPPIHERVRRERVGLVARWPDWWREGILADPERWRDGAGPKFFALLELGGEPAGYALYRVKSKWEEGAPRGDLLPTEVIATSPEATRELWRFLFGIDLVARVKYWRVDPAAPLELMVADPRRLHVSRHEGLWLRFVDLDGALRARTYEATEPVVLEIEDAFVPENSGRWHVGADAGRVEAEADVSLDVADLASAYLGAFSFEQLARAGRARELRPGGIARASALFRTPLPPSCPEGF